MIAAQFVENLPYMMNKGQFGNTSDYKFSKSDYKKYLW